MNRREFLVNIGVVTSATVLPLATSGHGTPATHLHLAQRVVDFLNSLPSEQTLLYPYNK